MQMQRICDRGVFGWVMGDKGESAKFDYIDIYNVPLQKARSSSYRRLKNEPAARMQRQQENRTCSRTTWSSIFIIHSV